MQQTAKWQYFPEMQKNLLLGLRLYRLNINSAMCSICYTLLHIKPALLQHIVTLGLKYLTAYNQDNLPVVCRLAKRKIYFME